MRVGKIREGVGGKPAAERGLEAEDRPVRARPNEKQKTPTYNVNSKLEFR